MKRKIKVLRIMATIDPRFGGPAKTIIDSSLMLIKQGFEVHILTGDQRRGVPYKIIKSGLKKNIFFQ